MAFIARLITEAKIERLYRERNYALRNKDYDRVWAINMQISNCMNQMVTLSYYQR